MDILTFNEQGSTGISEDLIFHLRMIRPKRQRNIVDRFYIEYKKEASTTFNYDSSLDMIIYDHLISETDEPNRKETYVPDGDYEGFTWQNGQWLHVTQSIQCHFAGRPVSSRKKNPK